MNIGITHKDKELKNNGMALYGIVVRWLIWLVGEEMKFGLGWNFTSTTCPLL